MPYPCGGWFVVDTTGTIPLLHGRREVRVASNEGPLLHRRRLGVELRRLRGDRTLDEVAESTLISTSKLSRLENGQGVPQARDIRDLVAYYDLGAPESDRLRRWASAGRSQAWWRSYSRNLPANLDTYLDYESGASVIRTYSPAVVPPLLQTARYATALLQGLPPAKSEEEVQRLVAIRQRRKALLVESEAAPRLMVTIDEAVLRRPLGSVEDVREQLQHLHDMSLQKNISLNVVCFDVGAHAGLLGSFTVLQYADDIDRDIVAVESHTGDRFLELQSDVLDYLRIFDAITHKARDHDESRALISQIRSTFDSPQGSR
jgi:transcriptional regulator with XRE-family HTH domain